VGVIVGAVVVAEGVGVGVAVGVGVDLRSRTTWETVVPSLPSIVRPRPSSTIVIATSAIRKMAAAVSPITFQTLRRASSLLPSGTRSTRVCSPASASGSGSRPGSVGLASSPSRVWTASLSYSADERTRS